MISWTIEAAIESKCFDRILVSTEDEKIAEIARDFGAEVPFLRKSHSDDLSTVSEATLAALHQAKAFWQEEYETVVQLMANCPLRTAENIRESLEVFDFSSRTFQLSCFRFGWMNPWWAVALDDAGRPSRLFEDALNHRSQDLPPLFCPTGAIWIAKVADFLKERTFYGAGHCFEPMHWENAIDIDDYEDLSFAKAIWMKRSQTRVRCDD
jgi:N-acylneuraminate cytidylyltransferase